MAIGETEFGDRWPDGETRAEGLCWSMWETVGAGPGEVVEGVRSGQIRDRF